MRNQNLKNKSKIAAVLFLLFFVNSIVADISPNGGFSAPYFQADYIQDLSEFSSGIINPALLYRVNQFRIEWGGYLWGVDGSPETDELGYMQSSFLYPIRLRHTAGFSLIYAGDNYIQSTVESEVLGSDNFGELWVIGHYSYRLFPWLSLGINPKFVYQIQPDLIKAGNIGDLISQKRSSVGVGADLGVYFNPFDHYRFGDLGISMTFQDIVPANIAWRTQSGDIADQLITTRFRGGIRYALMNDRLIFDSEVVIDNLFAEIWDILDIINIFEKGDSIMVWDSVAQDSVMKFFDDEEKSYLEKVARVSVHGRFQWIPQIWIKAGWANNNIPYAGINFNVIYPLPEMVNILSVDVHTGYSLNETERGWTGMVKIATDFGPTREQRESKRLYDKLVVAPMNAYNEAMRLYVAGKYWEAGFAFGKVLALFPNFHLNDKATYYMGDCYVKLDLNTIARDVFNDALAEYTTSEVRANYLYGLQYLDYREGKFKDALKNHAFISNLYSESEIRPDADYLAGQIHFSNKNYSAAQQLLSNVGPESKSYLYAQYTMSIINVENNKIKAAVQNLQNIVSDTSENQAEATIRYAADNKLGQLFYEQVELRNAVEAFKRVPEGSEFGDEALLGIAWAWIKVNRPQECYSAIERLIALHPRSPLIPEAYLVKGYALMLMKRYKEALDNLNKCLELCKTDFASEEDLKEKKTKFDNYQNGFLPTEEAIRKNALRKPTDRIIAERNDLKVKYDDYARELHDYFAFTVLVEDNKKFFRRKEQILLDAEYAVASVMKIIGTQQEQEIIEKDLKKQEKIEDEIQKLEEQLKDLEDE